jgi:hypothetical protein
VRAAQLRLDPGLGSAWRWLRALLRPDSLLPPEPRTAGSEVVSLRTHAIRRLAGPRG